MHVYPAAPILPACFSFSLGSLEPSRSAWSGGLSAGCSLIRRGARGRRTIESRRCGLPAERLALDSPSTHQGRGASRGVQLRRRALEALTPVLRSSADLFLARRTRLSVSPVPEIRIQDRTGLQGAEELPGAHVSKGPALTLFPDSKRQRAPQRPTRDQEQDVLAIREALDVLGSIVPSHAVMSGQSRPELQLYPPPGILLRVGAAKCGIPAGRSTCRPLPAQQSGRIRPSSAEPSPAECGASRVPARA